MRGPKLFQSVSYGEVRQPPIPANFTTPGVPETGLIAVGSKPFIWLFESRIGVSVSHRMPRFKVSDLPIVQSSCAKAARYQLDRSSGRVSLVANAEGKPSSRLARPFPLAA